MKTKLKQALYKSDTLIDFFDEIRIVDPLNCAIKSLNNGNLIETGIQCNDIMGREKRCNNCISMWTYKLKTPQTKFEFYDGAIWLIYSTPVILSGNEIIVELFKNVTQSMAGPSINIGDIGNLAKAIDRLNDLAVTDSLTKVYNRRFIDQNLPGILSSHARSEKPFHLSLLDLDDFKYTNDTYGHLAGDYVLNAVAARIKEQIRNDIDWVARFGGEEFLIYLHNTADDAAFNILERIRKSIENPIYYEATPIRITVSIGYCKSRQSDTPETILKRCDHFMYKAKAGGKNTIAGTTQ